MMGMAYGAWIAAHYPTPEAAYGQCKEAVEAMTKAFPELRPARGFFFSIAWGERQHHWCVTNDLDAEIVDPTRHQFPGGGTYEELSGTDEEIADRVPTDVCMDCGDPVYHGATFCGSACENATIAYLNDVGRGGDGFGGGRHDYD